MKVILFAIGFSSLILFVLLAFNLIDVSHFNIKKSYPGVIVGGAILGIGFAIGGYCPGTSIVAAGRGRKDALIFIHGGLLGAFFYMLIFEMIKDTALFNPIAGGAVSIAETTNPKFPSLANNLPALVIAGPFALVFMAVAFLLPGKTGPE
jgi:hypothetical protein